MESEQDGEPPSTRLRQLADRLERSLGEAATVDHSHPADFSSQIRFTPVRDDALAFGWMELGSELVLWASRGGRWELTRSEEDMNFLEAIVESIIAGRVIEVFGPARSQVSVTLPDGRTESTRVASAPGGCLPMPLWTRWGRKVRYAPYLGAPPE